MDAATTAVIRYLRNKTRTVELHHHLKNISIYTSICTFAPPTRTVYISDNAATPKTPALIDLSQTALSEFIVHETKTMNLGSTEKTLKIF